MDPSRVLSFWFGDLDAHGCASPEVQERWWKKDPAFDAEIRERFSELYREVMAGEHEDWLAEPKSWLAYVIVLDQLGRNMHRDTAGMYAGDERALRAVEEGLEAGHDAELGLHERCFAYMPLMHAEDREAQRRCVKLFEALRDDAPVAKREGFAKNVEFAERHAEIVERFGRFPHRNEVLGRETTEEEARFLEQPGSSF